jgi:translation initiation factor 3 subunit A
MASSSFFHKPELALRRALELEGIHQEDAALALLHEVLSSRRHRTWTPAYEQIMIAYIDLCLKLFKSREAKDGLHQYRNLAQTQAPGSLEKVILHLMHEAEQKCLEAKAFVDAEALANSAASGEGGVGDVESSEDDAAAVADDVDGDDEGGGGFAASPQAILLSTMSTDPAKSQRDSTLLLPSLKFLWETYRAVLDILRSNSKLEHVYHAAAQSALAFCRTYKRRMEFRHLCDMLRLHLGNLRQYGGALDSSAAGADSADAKSSSKVRWVRDATD